MLYWFELLDANEHREHMFVDERYMCPSPTGYVQVFEYKIYLLDGGWMEGGRVRPVRIGIDITQSDSVICL